MTNWDWVKDYKKHQDLWIAVIGQAFADLKRNNKKKLTKIQKSQAILWLNKKKEFLEVCKYANIDPLFVLGLKEKAINTYTRINIYAHIMSNGKRTREGDYIKKGRNDYRKRALKIMEEMEKKIENVLK